jgi:copper chaperone CopZ
VIPRGAATRTGRPGPGAAARSAAGKNYAVGVTLPNSHAPEPSGPPATGGPEVTAELHIEGMHCSSCVGLIEETHTEQEGGAEAVVDLDTARAVVRYDPGVIGPDALRTSIVVAGYPATPVG